MLFNESYQYQGKGYESQGKQWYCVRAISVVNGVYPEREVLAENSFLAEEEFRCAVGFGDYSVEVVPLGF